MRKSWVAIVGVVLAAGLSQGACTNNKANAAAKAAAKEQMKLAAAGDDGKMICKEFEETASRLRKRKECRTAEEWEQLSRGAQKYVKDLERAGSAQPGGQSLGP